MADAPQFRGREREIARLVAAGASYAQAARVLGWSAVSVRVTAHRMAQRLDGAGTPKVKLTRWWLTRTEAT